MHAGLGLDLARQHRPDAILLDLHLPDRDGEGVLRSLKEDPLTADIPVIVLSADAMPSRIARLLANGAYDYLTKPLDVQRFIEVVNAALGADETPSQAS